jgi:hypothetical protein
MMHLLKTKFTLLTLLILTGMLSYAQPPKYSNDFMYIGVGAHNFGMGNAVVASTSDVTAGYWNPAGLVRIPTKCNSVLCIMSTLPELPSLIMQASLFH